MHIQHISELFALDGRAFVTEAYQNLLHREPDAHGLAYYLGQLSTGYGKAGIIAQLAQSPECRPHDKIQGLQKLIADEQRAKHWFWGAFGRRNRLEKTLQSGLAGLAHIEQRLGSLHGAMLTQAQQIGGLEQHVAQLQTMTAAQITSVNEEPRLSEEVVRQMYREILGREPENDQAIAHHANQESVEALRQALLDSEEFKSRISGLAPRAMEVYLGLKGRL